MTSLPPAKKQKTSSSNGHSTKPIRIGGVPEHFNYLFTLAKERGLYEKYNVDVEFVIKKCGTGAMIESLKNKEVDMIVALTEGLVADITKGSNVRILGTYVQSPLCWAISAGSQSEIHSVGDLKGGTFAISRYGSGSHLMAYVLAMQRGWDPQKDINFKVVGAFKALRDSVNDLSSGNGTSAFMWETFTTKPYHDSGEVRRVGDITTPWPCFMVAGLEDRVTERLDDYKRALAAVNEAAQMFKMERTTMPLTISKNYGINEEDARLWFKGVNILAHRFVSQTALETALRVLVQTGVLPKDTLQKAENIIDKRVAELKKDIQAIPLYGGNSSVINRLYTTLEKNGYGKNEPIDYEALSKYDQTVYHGIDAVKDCIDKCNINSNSNVMNIGSGMGGCARYLSGKTGCNVLGIEVQNDLHTTAIELTNRTKLSHKVTHMGGDFLQLGEYLSKSKYDAIVSWLTILHFQNQDALFNMSKNLLRPGGKFYAQDFVTNEEGLNVRERTLLSEEVFCNGLLSREQYRNTLHNAGFRNINIEDVTDDWTQYTLKRSEEWNQNKKELVELHGEETWEKLNKFYSVIQELFKGTRLRGIILTAEKPMGW